MLKPIRKGKALAKGHVAEGGTGVVAKASTCASAARGCLAKPNDFTKSTVHVRFPRLFPASVWHVWVYLDIPWPCSSKKSLHWPSFAWCLSGIKLANATFCYKELNPGLAVHLIHCLTDFGRRLQIPGSPKLPGNLRSSRVLVVPNCTMRSSMRMFFFNPWFLFTPGPLW